MAERRALLGAVAVLVAGCAAVLVLTGSDSYEVRARFLNAGQLVKGNNVEVAGRKIGSIKELRLTDNGRAEIVLGISDPAHVPLHRGTRIAIRTVGLAGVANRYLDVTPGSRSAPEIEDGGVLGTDATLGIVDLDMLLNALGPLTRKDLRTLIVSSARGLGESSQATNRLLRFLNPAVGQTRALLEDVATDQAAIDRLVAAAATVASTLASREDDVREGVTATATTLAALASQRAALRSTLRRAPPVLRRSRATLRRVRGTLAHVRPALREARPLSAPLTKVLRRLVPTARAATPVVRDAATLMAPLRKTLALAPRLAQAGIPALRSTTSAVDAALPVFGGLRAYALDSLQGLVLGAGNTGGHYDANGQYIRIIANMDLTRSSPAGLPGLLLPDIDLPPLTGRYRGATARCPGAAAAPVRDSSNRRDQFDRALCDPEHGR